MSTKHTPFRDSSMEDAFQLGRLDGQVDLLADLRAWVDARWAEIREANEKLKVGRSGPTGPPYCPLTKGLLGCRYKIGHAGQCDFVTQEVGFE